MICIDIRRKHRKIPFMTRTFLALFGVFIIILSVVWMFKLDQVRHEKELRQWAEEQNAISQHRAIESKQ